MTEGNKDSEDERKRRECTLKITDETILEIDPDYAHEFSPEDSFEDAVTKMIQRYNSRAAERRVRPIGIGDVVRVRVFGEFDDKRPRELSYSCLDRLIFDGERAQNVYGDMLETQKVGDFAGLPRNEEGGFQTTGKVELQIASYGKVEFPASKERPDLQIGKGEEVDLSDLFDDLK